MTKALNIICQRNSTKHNLKSATKEGFAAFEIVNFTLSTSKTRMTHDQTIENETEEFHGEEMG